MTSVYIYIYKKNQFRANLSYILWGKWIDPIYINEIVESVCVRLSVWSPTAHTTPPDLSISLLDK